MKSAIFCILLGVAVAQYGGNGNGGNDGGLSAGYNAPNGRSSGGGNPSSAYGAPGGAEEELSILGESIPGGGVPGEDFPVLSEVPETGFACEDQEFPGYYADVDQEAGCQVFHICQERGNRIQKDSFLCPNGTIFNQQYLVCDWWFNFDCATAEEFYAVNEAIGQDPNAAAGGYGPSAQPANGNGYGNGNGNGNGGGRQQNGNGGGNGNSYGGI